MAQASNEHPWTNAPLQVQHDQPIYFTVAAALETGWTLSEEIRAQCAMPWTSTTPVATQGAFRWNLLEYDPVMASLIQIWNLSDDQSINLSSVAVRAFHFGELV